MPAPERLRLTVPASSANLGPGFDCLAVALELRNELLLRVTGGSAPLRVRYDGRPSPPPARDLLRRSFLAAGGPVRGVELRCRPAIPIGRGLGSSAAAIVSGIRAARALSGGGEPELALAASLEGHPDNVAAALLGGFVAAWRGAGGVRALRLSAVAEGCVGFVLVLAERPLPTARARAALPASVPHADAAHTAGRAALLVAALSGGRSDLLKDALDDRLHEPQRAALAPLLAAVRERLRGTPALGATLSGAGPSVLVWCPPGEEPAIAAGLEDLAGARSLPLAPAGQGVTVSG